MNYKIISLPDQNQTQGAGAKSYKILSLPNQGNQQSPAPTANALPGATQTPTQPSTVMGRMGQNFSKDPVFSAIGQGAIGLGKSVLGTAADTANIGKNIANEASKVPGLGFLKTTGADKSIQAAQQASQPTNTVQAVGKGIGDVAQFFIPGGQEAEIGKGAEAGIEGLKLGEKIPVVGKAAEAGLKIASKAVITGASMASVQAAQGGTPKQVEEAGVAGGVAGGIGKALEIVSPGIARLLEKASFKLSPAKAAKLGQNADKAASFISDNKIMGTTASKAAKLDNITSQMETAIKSSIPDATVPKQQIIDTLKTIPDQFKGDQATYPKVKSDIASAIATLQETQPDNVKLEDVLSAKRSYGKAAYNKDGSEMIKESKAAISNVFYDAIDNKMVSSGDTIKIPSNLQRFFGGSTEMSLKDFNATYSKAVKASQLTEAASNRKDLGLMTRLLMVGLGGAIGEKQGGLTGALTGAAGAYGLEELGSSGITSAGRSLLGQGLQTAGTTIPAITKAGLPMFNQNGSQQPTP